METRAEKLTHKDIANKFGMSYEQIRGYFKRKYKNQQKIETGKTIHKKAD